MNKPIIVGISGSAGSQAALAWALQRASRHRLPLIIIHAVDDRWMSPELQYQELIRESGMDLLKKTQSTATAQAPDVKVEVELRHGSVGAALREASKEASMVVVGAHDRHWMDGGPLKDRALQIASASDSPVAVIPAGQGTGDRGVVVGVDGSEEALQAVRFAAAEADRGGDELTVVLAFKSPARWFENQLPSRGLAETIIEEQRVVLSESVVGLGETYPDLTIHQRLETDTEPAKALVDIATGARLLVMGSRGRGGFSRLVLGSTAHAVLLHVPCPTVVTRLHKVQHED
ncbi:nucleotide-binding universal stress UspA family protein [Arthrobacter sp. V4I6]|uniref:universal stress protein n=1 Tax=unclassified Arthrobacter TaxID=235627 RepID=UPI00277D33C7|nr:MULTISPECIES: universal stress protein [unclassified Arthrobacter]MDQ0821163.1 nucleotide-binding universal stress UspA family protein [Arthrobacter sp. V1I7]MDQ0855426.1 nucleotide-binding universal stress UspA family protein [Arthrobacter sp. V4I6]